MARVTILYFAALRDASGVACEVVDSSAPDLRALYNELQARHALPFPARQLRVAVDGDFAAWDEAPRDGTEVAFIPPVSGG
ncbi:molybdopterin synthase sulfur carrier subunit [Lysobacter niabensis]|uniref:Molybdopterin synthase sulfur carrier subunit n=2 Tax=Agrilutibacter niabensis TaxID=380628 RepID=A0ABU1VL12_9GAMM|nr:molybdopterin synthase sulfur carrier subunit [Lysobacter niabensis]